MALLFRKDSDLPKRSLWQRIKDIALTDVAVIARGGVNAGSLEQIEEILLQADFGVPVTLRLVDDVSRQAQRGAIKTEDEFKQTLRNGIEQALRAGHADAKLIVSEKKPTVILVIGVNGAGKTTFIGKLCTKFHDQGKRVVVGAAHTFDSDWSYRALSYVVISANHELAGAFATPMVIVAAFDSSRLNSIRAYPVPC